MDYDPNYVSRFVKQTLRTLLGVKPGPKLGSPTVEGPEIPDPRHMFIAFTLPLLLNGPPPVRQEQPPPLELTEEEWRVADEAMRRWRDGFRECDR